ncbi:NAD(P)-binding protein [Cadophora sp. DSE1049]|nr:NAD(P)-binding protein [Cadophora sp. DSE1049]
MAVLDTYQVDESTPKDLTSHEVLIRIHAVSLNPRDTMIIYGGYPLPYEDGGVVASDCSAEVVIIGSGVTDFKIGGHVAPIFDLDNLDGLKDTSSTLGGDATGVLRQFAVFEDEQLVHLPEHLSWEEACTITCAGVTAWSALGMPSSANKNRSALLQGTGAISMFALLICLAAGIRPIITSSSDEKLRSIVKLLPNASIGTINYRTQVDMPGEIKRLTGGLGVDIVVNNSGPASLSQDIESLRRGGTVSFVGGLGGYSGDPDRTLGTKILLKPAVVKGIALGSKLDFQNLNSLISNNKISLKILIDQVFDFDDAETGLQYLSSGRKRGKVIIRV